MEVKQFIEQRVQAILRTPELWGPPAAVEMQLIQLVELWLVYHGGKPDSVLRTYREHVTKQLGSPGGTGLWRELASRRLLPEDWAGSEQKERFVGLLRSFVNEQMSELRLLAGS